MKIRRDDRCAACAIEVPAGSTAYWIRTERIVRCVPCQIGGDTGQSGRRNAAGESAQREYDRRSTRERARKEQRVAEDAEWRASIKLERPVLGRIASLLTPKPQLTPESQSTKAWKTGAEGERRVAAVLDGLAGVEVLHDRLVPGGRANIDHIAVGPSGVFVIDAKNYTGRIGVRDVGGMFRADVRLYVNNRDRTPLVDGVLRQVDVVRTALGADFAEVAVQAVLCFVGCEWGWFSRSTRINGVTVLWPTALADHVRAEGCSSGQISAIADRLRGELHPAT